MVQKKRITHGVSFPDQEILEDAKRKAASMQISFSSYVNQLIRNDLGRSGVFDWKASDPPPPSAHRAKKGRFKEPSPLNQEDAGGE